MEKIYGIFCDNGYPKSVVKRTVECKCFKAPVVFTPALRPLYLKLSWLGGKSEILVKILTAGVTLSFSTVRLLTVFETNPVFTSFVTEDLSYLQNSSIVYKSKCYCEAEYVG